MALLETSIYVHPQFPVEFVIRVEGAPMRVAIDWDAIEQLMGAASTDTDQVRDFLHRHRAEIAFAIQAQLAAHGTPLSRQLTMSLEDLRLVGATLRRAADPGSVVFDATAEETRTGTVAPAPTGRIDQPHRH